ncbi:MAG: stage II sporulation protein D [Bacilli bacterium]|nr:stage II sporulation protein D [Bacilli bacterium]
MFYKHQIIRNDDGDSLYLFLDFNYEFSHDFNLKGKKEKIETLYDKVMTYIKEKKIDFKMGKIFIVVGGLIVGLAFAQNHQYSELKGGLEPKFNYVEQIDIFGADKTEEDIFAPPVESKAKVELPNKIVQTPVPITPPVKKVAPVPPKTTTTPTVPRTQAPAPKPTPPPAPETAPTGKIVTLYRYNGTVEQIELEEYIVGVVSAEMPASFNTEALKAQSILARTYALKKIDQNQVLKDDVSNQVYKDINQLKTLWGNSFQTYYNKVKIAVASTKGQYLTYNGQYIEAVYHSTSNGQTEDSIAVWGNAYPYLKSVDSHWDLNASSYLRETTKEFNVLSSIIGLDFNADTNIEVISRTNGNRIDKIKIDDTIFTGIELRSLLGLRSADFDIKIENDKAVFVTRGYGHGVGMSQYGANGMANQGYGYKSILSHYYPNTQLKN